MRNLLYIVLLFTLTNCAWSGSQHTCGLDSAESLLQTDPAAAMERLNAYDVTEFHDSATMARWALLYSEAMVVNRLTAPTDTIVNIAIDYYAARNMTDRLRHAQALKALMVSSGKNDPLATALYLQKEKEFMLYRERSRNGFLLLAGLFVLLAAAAIIARQHWRLKLRDAQNASLIAEADSMRAELASTLDSRFSTLDDLCQTYYETQGTASERKAIVSKVKAQIEALKSDDRVFAEMERSVNDCRNGILSALRQQWPDVKPEEYRLLVYLACGLSARSIALLLDEKIEVVYKRKSRLKSKVSALDESLSFTLLTIF